MFNSQKVYFFECNCTACQFSFDVKIAIHCIARSGYIMCFFLIVSIHTNSWRVLSDNISESDTYSFQRLY